jgi:hypothetical protein
MTIIAELASSVNTEQTRAQDAPDGESGGFFVGSNAPSWGIIQRPMAPVPRPVTWAAIFCGGVTENDRETEKDDAPGMGAGMG